MKKKRSHKLRNGALGLGAIGAALFFLLPFDGGFGLVGDGRDWVREKTRLTDPEAERADGGAQAAARCQLRLDAEGLELAGEAAEVDDAIAACESAGAADFVVTGDARYGEFESVRDALEAAGIDVYLR